MSKVIKLTDPKEIQAARNFRELRKKLAEHNAYLLKNYNDALVESNAAFTKKFREYFTGFIHKHAADPVAAYAANTYVLLDDALDDHGDVYIMLREDYNEMQSPPEVQPVNHAEVIQDRVLH